MLVFLRLGSFFPEDLPKCPRREDHLNDLHTFSPEEMLPRLFAAWPLSLPLSLLHRYLEKVEEAEERERPFMFILAA